MLAAAQFLILEVDMQPGIQEVKVIISFQSIGDLSQFKRECQCGDFYIDRDGFKMIGTFTQQQIELATEKYGALYKAATE